ncbi:hypothetical protein [Stomatohabitans albus]|uniref:hypothetical protein n=1 Tax=Stomatohabitans albus TaxID=3110766 RepID=UPI00300C4872
MDNEDHIKAWLEDLDPDEPLAMPQESVAPSRRIHPLVLGALSLGVMAVLALGVSTWFGQPTPTHQGEQTDVPTAPISTASPSQTREQIDTPSHGPDKDGQLDAESGAIPGTVADGEGSTQSQDDDPHNASPRPSEQLAQLVLSAGSQWVTHASAEESVYQAIAQRLEGSPDAAAIRVKAIQSLPFADIGRIVQVRSWAAQGVQGRWAVPVREDGVVLANPWLISSDQSPLSSIAPHPEGTIDAPEAIDVLTKAGWTHVNISASGMHPDIPDVLIVSFSGIPPQGSQTVETTLWLGGSPGSRHVIGLE